MSEPNPPSGPGELQSVGIIGAGFAGLGAAIQLARTGNRRFVVFEKAPALGGTWRENTYPGAACDIPSDLYCFSFAAKRDWSRRFAEQSEILRYLNDVADTFDVRRHIRFGTEVASLRWLEDLNQWEIVSSEGDLWRFDTVIVGVGQLHRPATPTIDGDTSFAGPRFHSARWDHGVSLRGRRVAVVGNGASAVQFVPPVAAQAERVTIFQRSPNFVGPKKDVVFSPTGRDSLRRIPLVAKARRLRTWLGFEARFVAFKRGSRVGDFFAQRFRTEMEKIATATPAAPGLTVDSLAPTYPPGCKRILISDNWYETLMRPNVEVVTDPIERFGADHVTAGGTEYPADVVIYGTGFLTNDFLTPMAVHGRDGAELNDVWRDGANAYLGIMVPQFPNLFILYGPNTNLGHNSIVFMLEQQIDFVLRTLRTMRRRGAAAVEVPAARHEAFMQKLNADLDESVWAAECTSWYKTAGGRIVNNWSGTTWRYRRELRAVDIDSLDFTAARAATPIEVSA